MAPGLAFRPLEVGQQFLVDELPDARLPVSWRRARIRRGPVAPAVGLFERRREGQAQGLGFLGLVGFALVEDAEEQNPGEFRDVLHGAGAVDRRMMSQMDLTAGSTDWGVARGLPLVVFGFTARHGQMAPVKAL